MYVKNRAAKKPNFDHMSAVALTTDASASTRELLFIEQEQNRLRHEQLTGVNREEFDVKLHAQAEMIWDGYNDRERRAMRGVLSKWSRHIMS